MFYSMHPTELTSSMWCSVNCYIIFVTLGEAPCCCPAYDPRYPSVTASHLSILFPLASLDHSQQTQIAVFYSSHKEIETSTKDVAPVLVPRGLIQDKRVVNAIYICLIKYENIWGLHYVFRITVCSPKNICNSSLHGSLINQYVNIAGFVYFFVFC